MFEILAQTTQTVNEISQARSVWVDFWLAILAPLVPIALGVGLQYLRAKKSQVNAEAEKQNLESGQVLMIRLKSYLLDTAIAIAEQKFPQLARDVVNGKVRNADEAKVMIAGWAQELREKALRHFDSQGVDLKEWVSEETITDLIRSAADKASPLPGMVTANVVVKPEVAKEILTKGVSFVRDNYDSYQANFDDIKLDVSGGEGTGGGGKDAS